MSEPSRKLEDVGAAWSRARATLRAQVGEENFATWIAPLRCHWSTDSILLEAPDRVARERVVRHFLPAIQAALVAELVVPRSVQIVLAPVAVELPIAIHAPSARHTFDTFVTGGSNARAHGAACELCEDLTRGPLFIHGPSGVGKTHLLHAMFHALDGRGVRVACLPAAQLVSAMVMAFEDHRADAFWTEMGSLRALLLDDAQSLARQHETQERLLDGLGRWIAGGRALVLTSDRALDDVPELAARLGQRFARGITVAIDPPEPALRLAILQFKARAEGLDLDSRLAARIAVAVSGSIRPLEGALNRLLAYARLQGRRVDEALALEVIPELRARVAAAPLAVERIVEATAAAFGTTARRLYGRARRKDVLLPRQVAMYLARKLLRQPFVALAASFDRDHSTILYAWRAIGTRLGSDERLAALIRRIEQQLTSGEQ